MFIPKLKIKFRLDAIVATSIMVAFTGTVAAEDSYQGAMYVMPGIGIMHTDSGLKADRNSPAYSLRLGKEIDQHWDVQLGVSHARADENTALFTGGKFKQTLFGVDALYMFSRDKLRPFLLAGLGGAYNTVNYGAGTLAAASGSHTSWMGNVGLGVQYLVTDSIGLQADLRQVWSNAEATTLFGTGKQDSDIGNTYLNFGVIFRFGASKQVASAEQPAMEQKTATAEPVTEQVMADIPPTEEEVLPEMADPSMQAESYGPDKPAFEKLTLQAEVLFDFDKSLLKPGGKKLLDTKVITKMKAHPEVELLLVTGHSDRVGDEQYNQRLSERRAQAVNKYLISKGIEASRLFSVGKGEKEPVVECKGVRGNQLIDCLQPNRRVVLEIEVQPIKKK